MREEQIKLLTGTEAVAEAVKLLDVDVVAGYPIRPYTAAMNAVAKHIGNGELDCDFFWADSEHSQFEICKHAALTGARTFTGSSGVGWAQGFEPLVIIPTLKLPMVLMLGNRVFDDPGTFGVEWNDGFTVRDLGYMECWPEDPQEAFDLTIMAYMISEKLLIPSIINIEGGVLTHITRPVKVPPKEEITEYVPPLDLEFRVHPDKPATYGPQVDSQGDIVLPEIKRKWAQDWYESKKVIKDAHEEFFRRWGRQKEPWFDCYYAEDAEVVLLTMGTMVWSMRPVIRELREKGEKVGYVRLKRFRPFPSEELMKKLADYKVVGVCDRDTTYGAPLDGGVLFQDVRSSVYDAPKRPLMINFFVGLGGREIDPPAVREMFKVLIDTAKVGKVEVPVRWIGVRE